VQRPAGGVGHARPARRLLAVHDLARIVVVAEPHAPGNQLARWFAVVVMGLSAIDMMFFVPAYPFWALAIIAMDVIALYGLCAYGSRENLAA
jgi:hypothetical protein